MKFGVDWLDNLCDDFYHIKTMLENLNLGYKFKIRHLDSKAIMLENMLIAEVVETR